MSLELSGTTGVKGVAGSVAAPSIVGDDTNTGISFPAADTIKFSTGGVERMQITNSGVSGTGIGAGKIIQIVQGLNTTRQTFSSTTFIESNKEVTITPTAASSKILLLFNGDVNTEASNRQAYITVYRSINNGTYENIAPTGSNVGANNNNGFSGEIRGTSSRLQVNFTISYLDSPSYSVGNSITYKLYVRSNGSAVEVQSNNLQQPVVSLAMEVAA